jgi:hypothetical protein
MSKDRALVEINKGPVFTLTHKVGDGELGKGFGVGGSHRHTMSLPGTAGGRLLTDYELSLLQSQGEEQYREKQPALLHVRGTHWGSGLI